MTLNPPDWLKEDIKQIKDKKEKLLPKTEPKEPLLTSKELARLINNTGNNQRSFANHIGVSQSMISNIVNGKREMTQKINDKIIDTFGYMLPV